MIVPLFLALAPLIGPPPPIKSFSVCVGEDEWFPFSFVEMGRVRGVHVDLVRQAVGAAGYGVTFTAMPWARCINLEVKRGTMDAALSAGWRKDRAEYLRYPERAEAEGPTCQAAEMIMCNGHVLVVPAASTYEFDGDKAKVPAPIRIVHGYTQIEEYRKRGVPVDTGPSDLSNVKKMVRDGTGSVLILLQTARRLHWEPDLKGRFRIIESFDDKGASFLPFSKGGRMTGVDAAAIWKELAKNAKNPEHLEKALRVYEK